MEYIYSALLLHSAGKKVEEDSLKKVLEAAGAKHDAARIKALISSLEGVNIDEAIAQSAMVSVAAAPAVPVASEAKKEEKSAVDDEKKAEEAVAGLSSLFG
jgi:large subunit ribosomal protein L12